MMRLSIITFVALSFVLAEEAIPQTAPAPNSEDQRVIVIEPEIIEPEAAAPSLIESEAAERDPVDVVLRGLAESMRNSAEALVQGDQRLEATKALDAALRLAEGATHAHEIQGLAAFIFEGALARIRQARHQLQSGRPLEAAQTLDYAAATLLSVPAAAGLPAPPAEPPEPEQTPEDVWRVGVVNATGKLLGYIDDIRRSGPEPAIIVESSFYEIGGGDYAVPLEKVLLAPNYTIVVDASENLEDIGVLLSED